MKRRRKAFLVLAFGALLNVAVALTCGVGRHEQLLVLQVIAVLRNTYPDGYVVSSAITERQQVAGATLEFRRRALVANEPIGPRGLYMIQTGFPMRSLHGTIVLHLKAPLQQWDLLNALHEPLWPGFAVNTLFYAAILWLLIPGPFALRRFVRLRRGLCPKCAYPMGESSVCTECGIALSRRRMPNPT